ncbi:ash family protein [Pseudomonas sp. P116]|nr:ash family protein [Pseudomonas sp. P9(2020)]MBZ9565859.1 ash family protein [Pseudomonas sp. P116]
MQLLPRVGLSLTRFSATGFRSPDDTCSNLAPQKTVAVAPASEIRSMVAVCGRSSDLPGSSYPRSANPHIATTLRFAANGSSFSQRYEEVLLIPTDKPLHHYAHMSHPATDNLVLLINLVDTSE